MTLPLDSARAFAATHLTDHCTVRRDSLGVHDDVLDLATGRLLPTAPVLIYSGPCLVSRTGVGTEVAGARVLERKGYRVRLPYAAEPPRRGDTLTIDSAADPTLAGKVLTVTESAAGATYRIFTTVIADDPTPVAPS